MSRRHRYGDYAGNITDQQHRSELYCAKGAQPVVAGGQPADVGLVEQPVWRRRHVQKQLRVAPDRQGGGWVPCRETCCPGRRRPRELPCNVLCVGRGGRGLRYPAISAPQALTAAPD